MAPTRTAVSAAEIAPPVLAARPGEPARLGWLLLWMSGVLVSFVMAAVSVRALAKALKLEG